MPISLIRDGKVDDLHFRKWKGMWQPTWHVYHLFVGEELFGFVAQSHVGRDRWDAHSFNTDAPKALRSTHGFATRLDAGVFIVKTYGYWENN